MRDSPPTVNCAGITGRKFPVAAAHGHVFHDVHRVHQIMAIGWQLGLDRPISG